MEGPFWPSDPVLTRLVRSDWIRLFNNPAAADLKTCKQWQRLPSCFFSKPHQHWKKPTFPYCSVGRELLGSRSSVSHSAEAGTWAASEKTKSVWKFFYFFLSFLKWISSACHLEFIEISSWYGRQNRKRRAVFILVKLSNPDWIMMHFCIVRFG